MPAGKQPSVDHLWVWLSYLMVCGGWAFVSVTTISSGWAPESIGAVTVGIGSLLGGFIAGRQSPRRRLEEPAVAAALLAATLLGMAHYSETGAAHGGYALVGIALVAALVGSFAAHRFPGRGGPATTMRGVVVSTLVCCGSWVVMYFVMELWNRRIGDAGGWPVVVAMGATIFGCGAMAQLAMPATRRRVVASGGFFCPMLFLVIALLVGRNGPSVGELIGITLGVGFFAVISYGCAWAGAALAGRCLAKRAERVTLPPATATDA